MYFSGSCNDPNIHIRLSQLEFIIHNEETFLQSQLQSEDVSVQAGASEEGLLHISGQPGGDSGGCQVTPVLHCYHVGPTVRTPMGGFRGSLASFSAPQVPRLHKRLHARFHSRLHSKLHARLHSRLHAKLHARLHTRLAALLSPLSPSWEPWPSRLPWSGLAAPRRPWTRYTWVPCYR